MSQKQDRKREHKAIVIRGLDKSHELEVKKNVPNYINVAAYGNDVWVFNTHAPTYYRLKKAYDGKNTVERV